MDHGGHRENGRHKPDPYKSIHNQWMMPQHQMKDHQTMKLMSIMAERDSAIHERNMALGEKKVALAERDMAMLQRDAAIAERNNAIMERDSAIAALEFSRQGMNANNGGHGCRDIKLSPPQLCDAPYDHSREMHVIEASPISAVSESIVKSRKPKKLMKEPRGQVDSSKKAMKAPMKKKSKRGGGEDLNELVPMADIRGSARKHHEGKVQELGLNQVLFDDSAMPVPVCSCTGMIHQCYKWGNGGWQSACCTTKLSAHPLPMMPDKPRTRVGGRKMSGSAFAKLLTRLAAEGHDLSAMLDLKDHWAGHGTNRYIRK